MPFGIGSKSAQTPSESSQESKSSNGKGITQTVATLHLDHFYQVSHRWRKVGKVAKKGIPHHSQIFVHTMEGEEIANFGLFSDKNGYIEYIDEEENPTNPYKISTSYKPNPLFKTGLQITQAVKSAQLKCGPHYDLLHNNCQKFARLVMIELGASHNRYLFHP